MPRESQKIESSAPIEINRQVVDKIVRLIEYVSNKNRDDLARTHALTAQQVSDAVNGGGIPDGLPYETRSALKEIQKLYDIRFTVKFKDGRRVTDNARGAINVMDDRNAPVERLLTEAGIRGRLHLEFNIGGYYSTAVDGEVAGPREDITYIQHELDDILNGGRPSFWWMRTRAASATFFAAFGLAMYISTQIAAYALGFTKSPGGLAATVGCAWLVVPLTFWFSKRYDRLFPTVLFQFGKANRDRSASIWLLGQVIAVVIIPIAISYAFSTRDGQPTVNLPVTATP